ncbi:hypothetical protein [Burkholderia sp. WSM2230]|uniref:hypothetical protein n=1 Tax=Burkholderia sp. WSM2230 TaxID=944435 RepID=UPI00046FE69E|nr:hypothetical protein [Burkholderia sp. WSM2230]
MVDDYEIEKRKQGRLSLGIVKRGERILIAFVQPLNWEDNDFTRDAFKKKDFVECKQSVARQRYSSPPRIRFFVFDVLLSKKPGREAKGLMQFSARQLRKMTTEGGQREFLIIDAPLVSNGKIDYAHAHVGFSPEIASANRSVQAAAIQNFKDVVRAGGGPAAPEKFFLPYPFLYIRPAEVKLLFHRLRVWYLRRIADPEIRGAIGAHD